LDVTQIP